MLKGQVRETDCELLAVPQNEVVGSPEPIDLVSLITGRQWRTLGDIIDSLLTKDRYSIIRTGGLPKLLY